MRFEVWAPDATTVAVEVDGVAHDMHRVEADPGVSGPTVAEWWQADVDAGPGSRYWFSVDGSPWRPDPRSHSQPDGVDGPSEVDDPASFIWRDEEWTGFDLATAVLHEVHVGTFSTEGTFDGVIAHLDHLVDLGIDAIELLPVVEFAGDRGWGYDGVDLFAPHHAYGGPEGFRRLVDACHQRGVGVVLDVVYNHLGPAGNHLATFGPYFTDAHPTNWGPGVNVDGPRSDEVRAWIVANVRHWLLDMHVDGLRLDAVHAIVDDSAVHVLEQISTDVRRWEAEVGRRLWLIAESDRNDPRYVQPVALGGLGLDASWADEWHHALHAVLTGETDGYYADFGPVEDLVTGLEQAWVYAGRYSPHRGRTHGRDPGDLAAATFVVSAQNHDQIGNRAVGDRLSALVSPGRARLAAALLLTSPFVPMLFQGEEWAASTPFLYFTDHDDELGRAVTAGRRREFSSFRWDPQQIPDPQSPDTFARSVLRWEERDHGEHAAVLDWHRRLIALRRASGAPTRPEVTVDGGLLIQRSDSVIVVGNLSPSERTVAVDGTVVLGHDVADAADVGDGTLRLASDGVAVVVVSGSDRRPDRAAGAG